MSVQPVCTLAWCILKEKGEYPTQHYVASLLLVHECEMSCEFKIPWDINATDSTYWVEHIPYLHIMEPYCTFRDGILVWYSPFPFYYALLVALQGMCAKNSTHGLVWTYFVIVLLFWALRHSRLHVYFPADHNNDVLNLALVQYHFSQGEHQLKVAPHGNARYGQSYVRTMPSVMCKLKKEAKKTTPKRVLQFVSQEAGGIMEATSAGALPRSR